MNIRQKIRVKFALVILLALVAGLISYPKALKFAPPAYEWLSKLKINLGLDLQGGIHLEYKADIAGVEEAKVSEALQAAQDVIERRVNAFGVGEPLVQTAFSGGEHRIIVELPGIKDIDEAKKKIKETPFLEFKEEKTEEEMKELEGLFTEINAQAKTKAEEILVKAKAGEDFAELAKQNSEDPGSTDEGGDLGFVKKGALVPEFDKILFEGNLKDGEVSAQLVETQFGWHIIKKIEERTEGEEQEIHAAHILLGKKSPAMFADLRYKPSGLTGKNIKSAKVDFRGQGISEPVVALEFDEEGAKIFAEVTKRNVEKTIAIYLDNVLQYAPRVNEEIASGRAEVSGRYTIEEANEVVRKLNEGSIPVPISLVSQQSVEASLGEISLQKSLRAGMIGLGLVIVFMILYYRYLGLIASISLLIYTALMVTLFKLSALTSWQITLTLPGIAGFVLSIGMAVDANILIFERMKEEIRRGRGIISAIDEGFKRAWTSIRDGNVSSIITAVILIYIGTGFVKGFAVILFVGVLVSMFTAVTISRTMIKFLVREWISDKLWLIGVKAKKI